MTHVVSCSTCFLLTRVSQPVIALGQRCQPQRVTAASTMHVTTLPTVLYMYRYQHR